MKLIATLPNSKNYVYVGSNKKWDHVWYDESSQLVTIRSNLENPFNGQRLEINFKPLNFKMENVKTSMRLDFECYDLSVDNMADLGSCSIVRDTSVGKFPYSIQMTKRFYAFIYGKCGVDSEGGEIFKWLTYSLM